MTRTGMVPWPREYVDRYRAAGYWRAEPLGSWPRDWARRHGHGVAIVDGEHRLTYEDLAARVDALAQGLLEAGLAPGDNIVIQLPNTWEFVVLFLACQRIGVAPALALPQHRDEELAHISRHVRARAIVVPEYWREYDHHSLASRVAARLPWPVDVLVAGDTSGATRAGVRRLSTSGTADREGLDALAPDPLDAAFFLLSGGTTGTPKIIARTHDDYGYSVRSSAEACGYDANTVFLATLPMAHGLTLGGPGVLGVLFVGGRLVIARSPNPRTVFPLIRAQRVTTTAVTPAVAHRWLEAAGGGDADLSSLDMLQVAGAPLPRQAALRIEPVLGCRLQQVFGMSEGLHCYTRAGDPPEVVIDTQGRPISPDDELMVVDADLQPVPPGDTGELLVRGPTTIRGYFADPEADAESFVTGGWYRTGDLVSVDALGNVTVRGRTKDVVNRAGEKISAAEVERPLRALPQVAQAGVIAVPDPELGERVCACVVVAPGHAVSLSDLRAACHNAGLAEFKAPERVVWLANLPLTPVGKIDKKALREQVLAGQPGGLSERRNSVPVTLSEAELLRIYVHGTTVFEILRTALEFEVFEHLERAGGMELPAVAESLAVAPQPARVLLLGLASLGLVRKQGETYTNTDLTRQKLLRASPRFIGPLVDVQAQIINRGIGDLSAAMRQNTNVGLRHFPGPGTTLYERLTAHPELQRTYYGNMGDASQKTFPHVLDAFDFKRLRHVVDLGGGDGTNAIALATRFPHLDVTVFDQESVARIATGNAERAGVADRVRAEAGDLFDDPFPGGADGIMIFHFFEIWSLERNVKLLRKCHEALPDGGVVLIYNFVSADDNTGPLSAATMSAYFLALASGEGMTYSAGDMEAVLREAGFSRVERSDGLPFHHALVVGVK